MPKIKQGASPLLHTAHRRAQDPSSREHRRSRVSHIAVPKIQAAESIAAPAYRTSPCQGRAESIAAPAYRTSPWQQRASPLPHNAHRRAQDQARSIAAPAYRTSPCPRSKQQRASPLPHTAHRRAKVEQRGERSVCTTCHRHHPPPSVPVGEAQIGWGGVMVAGDKRKKNNNMPRGSINTASRDFGIRAANSGPVWEVTHQRAFPLSPRHQFDPTGDLNDPIHGKDDKTSFLTSVTKTPNLNGELDSASPPPTILTTTTTTRIPFLTTRILQTDTLSSSMRSPRVPQRLFPVSRSSRPIGMRGTPSHPIVSQPPPKSFAQIWPQMTRSCRSPHHREGQVSWPHESRHPPKPTPLLVEPPKDVERRRQPPVVHRSSHRRCTLTHRQPSYHKHLGTG